MPYSVLEAKPISQLCTVVDCEHKTAPYVDESEYLVVRTSNVRNGRLVMDDMKYTTSEGYKEWTQRAVPEYGDVLFTREAPAGESCLVPYDKKVCMGQRMVMLRPKKKVADPVFLSLILNTERTKTDISRLSIGSTVSRINIADIKKLKVACPPLPEQRKIAKILSTWDKAIATTEQLIAASQQQKKALMQQLLTGKKRLLNPETGMVFEGEWEEVRLSQLVKVTGGNAFKSEQFATQGIPLIKISNIKADYSVNVDSSVFIVEESKYEKFKVKTGDVLIAMSGATTGKVGCYRFNDFSYLNQRVGRFDPKKNKIIKPYLFQLLKLPKVQHDILIDAVGGAQPNISNKDIERLKVKVPAIGEQQKIASVLTAADKEIELLEAKLAHLKEEKKALMQQLLTGKRRVKVEHTEAA
ncbi:restriction endonuclease subunit S [Vibrio vulnificus]|uniref:restriction endonuclease subunit S n=1 Tax=Vibrio vulnificus TaxID=672 RepID=UPI00102A4FF2|nr:restriction endonuclease subunit S [Vibrio vulnificus]ELI0611830.1 restriction endonuclease subunit S [Vibrio vulnificus]MCU8272292.1 restriction endonuclease subunit S [Vibrio vulnificus]RZQ10384.1 restriction endonuclease subunit S [Vibrio vulnificus]HAS8501232.1 restriction endonuclease subunit S [Vibrio vulnificus]